MCLFIDIICNTLIFSTLVNKYYNKSSMAKILEVFWIRISLSELGCWDSNKLGPDQGSSLFQNRVRIWTKCTDPGSATLKLTMVQNEILKFNYTDKLRERKFGQQRACQSLPCIFCLPEFSIFFFYRDWIPRILSDTSIYTIYYSTFVWPKFERTKFYIISSATKKLFF